MNPATGFASAERARLPDAKALLPAACQVDLDTGLPVKTLGRHLWQQHQGAGDDRPLYWQRLMVLDELIAQGVSGDELADFERASRGQLLFDDDVDFRVLVTGFDPFHLDTSIVQTNPSGVAALQLDDVTETVGDRTAQIRTMVFPVRFADFDRGIVERMISPLIEARSVDLIVSVSMGREQFDLERYPGRRRSSPNPDNEKLHGGGGPDDPLVPQGLHDAPEFVEFSLPVAAMQVVEGPYQVRDNRAVTTLGQGDIEAASLDQLAREIAVQGSGGGYLSNEISYRLIRLCAGSDIPVGHIHTPRLQGFDSELLAGIVEQSSSLIAAAVTTLTDR